MAQATRLCSVEDCDLPANVSGGARGLCCKHYNRLMRWGSVDTVHTRVRPQCQAEGCERPNKARGYCLMHYARLTRTGAIERIPRQPDPFDGTPLKKCRKCGEVKDRSEFNAHRHRRDGLHEICRVCANARMRQYRRDNPQIAAIHDLRRACKRLGIDPRLAQEMLQEQGGVCAICRGEPNGNGRYHIDHDHVTGEVRGWLCHTCNMLLGHARDNIDIMLAAIEYLQNPPMRQHLDRAAPGQPPVPGVALNSLGVANG